jgi:pimeloyl-ACP methyl ester carboxylesterase
MSALVVNDDVVHYEVLGRGPGILFIHSWLGSWRYWIPVMQAVSTKHRTYAIDLLGFGDSGKRLDPKTPDNYKIEYQADMIQKFMDQLGVAKLAFVGHGLGGAVALRFAAKYPEMVARLMVINAPLISASIKGRPANTNTQSLLDWLVSKVPGKEELRTETNKLDPAVIQKTVESINEINLLADLDKTTAPTLLVNGERDEAITPPTEQGFNGFKPNLHQIIFEEGGHFLMLDDPAKFNRLLSDFLEATDLTSLELKDEWRRRMR